MTKARCIGCGKKLYTYDNTSIRRYKSPVKHCKKCGRPYADYRCHEIAIEGLPTDTFSAKAYIILVIFGIFLIYRGICVNGTHQLGVIDEMQWLLPAVIMLFGVICIIGGIYEIITIKSGMKQKKYDKLAFESRGRMENTEYVQTLLDLGYKVPTEYLQEVRKAEYEG